MGFRIKVDGKYIMDKHVNPDRDRKYPFECWHRQLADKVASEELKLKSYDIEETKSLITVDFNENPDDYPPYKI